MVHWNLEGTFTAMLQCMPIKGAEVCLKADSFVSMRPQIFSIGLHRKGGQKTQLSGFLKRQGHEI